MSEHAVILHHYPQSPVSEKVRVVLGIKGLDWRSVIIPRLPPKPNLTPLTGGYRLTPVMQIGADIYCDSHCIIAEIERRFPNPTLYPGGAQGLAWGIAEWTDGALFTDTVCVALTEMAASMPAEFMNDRGPLYFGPGFDVEAMKARAPRSLANVRAQFGWMNERLQSRDFMLGAEPGLPDALCYYLYWFLKDRMADAGGFLGQFPDLLEWAGRVEAIGHGNPQELADTDALEIAALTQPETPQSSDPDDPLGLSPGDAVFVYPEPDGAVVEGTVQSIAPNEIAIIRQDDRVDTVCVHFPRIGYRIERR